MANENQNIKTTIVGFALDVSGSMQSSIRNSEGGQLARIEGLRESLDTLLDEANRLTSANKDAMHEIEIKFFAYAYGVKLPGGNDVCDLFKLIEVVEEAKSKSGINIDQLAKKYKDDYEHRLKYNERSVAIELMGASARKLLSMSRIEAEEEIRNQIERKIKEKIHREIRGMIEREVITRMDEVMTKPLTLSLNQLTEKWEKFRESISTSNDLLGGGTPMKSCLSQIHERFQSELKDIRNSDDKILFIISDGESTDGDPAIEGKKIGKLGVQIISCFVSSSNVLTGKRLYANLRFRRRISKGAKTMFEISTRIKKGDPAYLYLKRNGWFVNSQINLFGWNIRNGSKLFAQINHSDLLKEFIQVVLAPIRAEHGNT